MLDQGRIRNAAEKAWGGDEAGDRRPHPSRTGEEPELSPGTAHGLRMLASLDEAVREANLVRRCYIRQSGLHG